MTNIHGDMIGLWQLLYSCKAEKTHLSGKVVSVCVCLCVCGGGGYVLNEVLQTNYKR